MHVALVVTDTKDIVQTGLDGMNNMLVTAQQAVAVTMRSWHTVHDQLSYLKDEYDAKFLIEVVVEKKLESFHLLCAWVCV